MIRNIIEDSIRRVFLIGDEVHRGMFEGDQQAEATTTS
jgi:hypothetical protein